jgi:arginyl-tRNA--protein-N-Asp/Glu arginylyltransferase
MQVMLPATQSAWPALPAPRNVPLTTLAEQDCPYLTGRRSMNRAFLAERMSPAFYHQLMDAGFRRSGTFIYQPICRGCRECQPIRVPVDSFTPSKSQRRTWRRNNDLIVDISTPQPSAEKFDLYHRYIRDRHDRQGEQDPQSFVEFLYQSPVQSVEFTYRTPAGRLVGVGICDVSDQSLSTVYFYFDPADARRGLGTFSSMREIAFAREREIPFYYLGYWVRGCESMRYKSTLRPSEVLHPDGVWRANLEG